MFIEYKCRAWIVMLALLLTVQAAAGQAVSCGSWYQSNKHAAYRHSAQERPDSALYYYRKAFSSGSAALNDLLMAANQAIRADSLDAARAFLQQAIQQGLPFESYNIFLERNKSKRLVETQLTPDSFERLGAVHRASVDQTLLDSLRSLVERDQGVRTDDNTPAEVMRRADSLNAAALRSIVQRSGQLPGYGEVGFEGTDMLELLFLHMDYAELNWFLPYILRAVRQCAYFDVDGLAYQIDRIAVASGRALYVDADDRLRYDTLMPLFAAGQSYSVTGYWYELCPADGKGYFWPVFPPLQNGVLEMTRKRLFLDSQAHYQRRNPWYLVWPADKLKKLFER